MKCENCGKEIKPLRGQIRGGWASNSQEVRGIICCSEECSLKLTKKENLQATVRTLLADEEFCERLAHIKYQDYEECYEWQPWELFDGRKDEIRIMKQALRGAAGIKEEK